MGQVGLLLGVSGFAVLGLLVLWALPGRPRRMARLFTMFGLWLALLVALVVGEAALALDRTVLSPSFHVSAFDRVDLPSVLPGVLADLLTAQLRDRDLGDAQRKELSRLTRECLAYALPPDWTKSQVSTLVSAVVSYLRVRSDSLNLSLHLREPKERALAFLASAKADARLVAGFKKLVSQLPDEMSASSTPPFAELERGLERIRSIGHVLTLVVPATGVLAALLALAVWLVAGRSRATASWLGSVLLVAGLTTAAVGVVAEPWVLARCAAMEIPPPLGGLPVKAWLGAEISGVLGWGRLAGLLTLAGGVVLVVLGSVRGRRGTLGV